jgi:hypothetical protein
MLDIIHHLSVTLVEFIYVRGTCTVLTSFLTIGYFSYFHFFLLFIFSQYKSVLYIWCIIYNFIKFHYKPQPKEKKGRKQTNAQKMREKEVNTVHVLYRTS